MVRNARAASGPLSGHARPASVAAAIIALAGLAACGGSSGAASSAPSHPSAPAGLITFAGTLRVHGAVAEQKSFTSTLAKTTAISTCAQVGSLGTGAPAGLKAQFSVPTPAAGGSVFILATVVPYTGPGSYGRAAVLAGGGTEIRIGSTSYNALAPRALVSVTTHADGSGAFAFTGAAPPSSAHSALSGTVTWTCST
jgi:hypothetical protein